MRTLFSIIFMLCAIATSAQTTPPSVVRSSAATTQVDPYLTALRRLGIPTVAGDSLETTGTPQNSVKVIYNTVLGRLRVYNPLTSTWSDASPSGIDSVKVSNGLQIMGDSSIGLGGEMDEETFIKPTIYAPLNIYNEDFDVGFMHNGNYVEMRGGDAALVMGDDVILTAPKSTLASSDYVVMVDSIMDNSYNRLRLVPKSDFSGGGNYLPLNIQDSTTVELNGNSVMFKGDNHSLVMNTPFDALAIGGAVMDGFRAQQYDDILTMTGVMKVPVFFGDTIRYPLMFLSHGMPFSDTAKFALLRGLLGDDLGFVISTTDEDSEEESSYLFSHDTFSISRDYQSVFEIDLATGVLTVTNEIVSDSYHPKTSPYSVPQMQDLARTIIANPSNNTLINPETKEVVVKIESDSVNIMIPDAADCEFWHLYIKNNSSTVTTVKTENDEVLFWVGGVLSDEYTATAGTVTHILFDGENYIIE